MTVLYGDELEFQFTVHIPSNFSELRLLDVRPKDTNWGEGYPDFSYDVIANGGHGCG